MHNLFSAHLACFLNDENASAVHRHPGDVEGRGKTVSIETEALSGNYWLLAQKKTHVCSGVELFLVLVGK